NKQAFWQQERSTYQLALTQNQTEISTLELIILNYQRKAQAVQQTIKKGFLLFSPDQVSKAEREKLEAEHINLQKEYQKFVIVNGELEEKNDLQDQLQKKATKLQELTTNYRSLKKAKEEVDGELVTQKENYSQLETKFQKLESSLTKTQKELSDWKDNFSALKDEKEDLSEKLAQTESKLTEANQSLETWQMLDELPVIPREEPKLTGLEKLFARVNKLTGKNKNPGKTNPGEPSEQIGIEEMYAILGVDANASEEEIKSAYKKLSTQYHPDKQINKSAKDREFAEDRMKQINQAYAVFKKLTGGLDTGEFEDTHIPQAGENIKSQNAERKVENIEPEKETATEEPTAPKPTAKFWKRLLRNLLLRLRKRRRLGQNLVGTQQKMSSTDSCSNCSQLETQLRQAQTNLDNKETELESANREISHLRNTQIKSLEEFREEREKKIVSLEQEAISLGVTIRNQQSEIAKEQREAQSTEEENHKLKLQINDLKYGIGSTPRVPDIPTIPNSPDQGTTTPPNNSNSLNPTHATIFFGIGVVVGERKKKLLLVQEPSKKEFSEEPLPQAFPTY
ncbi:17283_t:CDS:2, partial [Racocetra persica]